MEPSPVTQRALASDWALQNAKRKHPNGETFMEQGRWM